MKTQLFAPDADVILNNTNSGTDLVNRSIYRKLTEVYSVIQQNLPWTKRLGKIRRRDFWEIMGTDTIRPDIKLGDELIKKLKIKRSIQTIINLHCCRK